MHKCVEKEGKKARQERRNELFAVMSQENEGKGGRRREREREREREKESRRKKFMTKERIEC